MAPLRVQSTRRASRRSPPSSPCAFASRQLCARSAGQMHSSFAERCRRRAVATTPWCTNSSCSFARRLQTVRARSPTRDPLISTLRACLDTAAPRRSPDGRHCWPIKQNTSAAATRTTAAKRAIVIARAIAIVRARARARAEAVRTRTGHPQMRRQCAQARPQLAGGTSAQARSERMYIILRHTVCFPAPTSGTPARPCAWPRRKKGRVRS